MYLQPLLHWSPCIIIIFWYICLFYWTVSSLRAITMFLFGFFFFSLLQGKICPELTSATSLLPFFWSPNPQYVVVYASCKLFWFFYVSHCHSMATDKWCGSATRKWTLGCQSVKCQTLTTRQSGLPVFVFIFVSVSDKYQVSLCFPQI